jgi:uncharacterized protein YndB with AHSA1/START domain
MGRDGGDGRWLEVRRHLRAPWQFVFTQWIEPHELAAWFGPIGFKVAAYAIDAVEGGGWWMTLRTPGGEELTVSGRFLTIEPPERLRFTWAPEREGGRGPETEVQLTLRPDQGTTRLTLRHGPLAQEQVESYRKTWKSILDSLVLKLSEEGANN